MRIKTKFDFPKNITAKSLYKDTTLYSTIEEINALGHGHLVVAWDTPITDDAPFRFYGFLEEILFDSEGSIKYSIFCPDCGNTLHFDKVSFVRDNACPKVYYNDGGLQGVGRLIGIKETFIGENADQHIVCYVRVAPGPEASYHIVGADQLTFVENIPLGITKKDDKEADNVH